MLGRGEGFSPAAVESDEDKHEALGVEGRPTEEEREDDNNWNMEWKLNPHYQLFPTQHVDDGSLALQVGPATDIYHHLQGDDSASSF